MSAERTAARRAWALSSALHGAILAVLLARPVPPADAPPVGVVTTARDGHSIALVALESPPAPAAQPVSQPADPRHLLPAAPPPALSPLLQTLTAPPTLPAAPSLSFVPTVSSAVQPVVHREPAPAPVANARGSPGPMSPPKPVAALPPGAVTAFFGVPAVGKSVVFVIDRSASMGLDGRLDRARREVAASLRLLPPAARFQVIAYNRAAEPLRANGLYGLLPATPDAVAAAVAALDSLTAEGATDHLRALKAALTLRPDVIYFLTDEDDLTWADVRAVTQLNRGTVCMHALCLVPTPPGRETPMQALARANRGLFRVVGW
jgi:hypothetical protein